MRCLCFSLVLMLWPWVAGAQAFTPRRPFVAAQSGCSFPQDDFSDYTLLSSIDGLNGGCLWPSGYVEHNYENVPAVWLQDTYDSYTNGLILEGVGGGIAWYTLYVLHTYEDLPKRRFLDALDEYAAGASMISDTLTGGTNYVSTRITNITTVITWTNSYVGKGY